MSQLVSLRLLQRLNNFQRLQSIHTQPKKRFYKNVSVVQNNGQFEINLDHRKLKTPLGSPLMVKVYQNIWHEGHIYCFQISNESLATAVANEWLSQKKEINLNQMHINGTVISKFYPRNQIIPIQDCATLSLIIPGRLIKVKSWSPYSPSWKLIPCSSMERNHLNC